MLSSTVWMAGDPSAAVRLQVHVWTELVSLAHRARCMVMPRRFGAVEQPFSHVSVNSVEKCECGRRNLCSVLMLKVLWTDTWILFASHGLLFCFQAYHGVCGSPATMGLLWCPLILLRGCLCVCGQLRRFYGDPELQSMKKLFCLWLFLCIKSFLIFF